jgi:hypothetical protein
MNSIEAVLLAGSSIEKCAAALEGKDAIWANSVLLNPSSHVPFFQDLPSCRFRHSPDVAVEVAGAVPMAAEVAASMVEAEVPAPVPEASTVVEAEAVSVLVVVAAFAVMVVFQVAASAVVVVSPVAAFAVDRRWVAVEWAAVHLAGSAHREVWRDEAADFKAAAILARSEIVRRIFILQSTMASGIRSATPAALRVSAEAAISETRRPPTSQVVMAEVPRAGIRLAHPEALVSQTRG